MDREGPQQAWSLLYESCAEDGSLWRVRQRTAGPRYDFNLAEDVCRQDEPEVEDSTDPRVQPYRMPMTPKTERQVLSTDTAQIAPIQNAVYLTSMAVIAGARTFHQIRATVRAGFMPVMKVSWITSPIALAFAQAFLPNELWVPFFNIISFVIGTYINAHTKKKRLLALRRKYQDGRESGGRSEYDRRSGGQGGQGGPGGY